LVVVVGLRRANVGQLPLKVFLELLEALECDFEAVLVGEAGGVVHDIDPEEGDDRHLGGWVGVLVRETEKCCVVATILWLCYLSVERIQGVNAQKVGGWGR
jgi:hypothetical protein